MRFHRFFRDSGGSRVLAGMVLALVFGLVAAAALALSRPVLPGSILNADIRATYGVGGVLRTDGVLYQWRPEQKKWVDLDESFRLDGQKRAIMPLPVRATDVARMEGFGFIVTKGGNCWLYNLDSNRWENIGHP